MNALVAVGSPEGLDELIRHLRSWGVWPIVAPNPAQATRLLATHRPDLAIVGEGPHVAALLQRLQRGGVPVVLTSSAEELTRAGVLRMLVAAVLSPAKPDRMIKLVDLTERALGPHQEQDVLEAGPLRLDRTARVAFLDGKRLDLPPKEFALLEHLALHAGEPVPTEALRDLLWPTDAPATAEDVHRHVYRLRRLLRDQRRQPPLISNRRGFGYVFDARVPADSKAG